MKQSFGWRLSVRLQDGSYRQTAFMDFARRETIEAQVVQLLFKQHNEHSRALFEFRNEYGEELAFRAASYSSYVITSLETLAAAV